MSAAGTAETAAELRAVIERTLARSGPIDSAAIAETLTDARALARAAVALLEMAPSLDKVARWDFRSQDSDTLDAASELSDAWRRIRAGLP
jgi:hypothetical protein